MKDIKEIRREHVDNVAKEMDDDLTINIDGPLTVEIQLDEYRELVQKATKYDVLKNVIRSNDEFHYDRHDIDELARMLTGLMQRPLIRKEEEHE